MNEPRPPAPASIFVSARKAEVVGEYDAASALGTAHERAIWGSAESMEGRFRWAVGALPWPCVQSWLDVGCGEAGLFVTAEKAGHRVRRLVGVDLTPAMIDRARRQPLACPAEFRVADLEALRASDGPFDVITLLGVLQKCGVPPPRVFAVLQPMLAPDGVLLLTTKNVTWSPLAEGRLQPEPGHSWFAPNELAAMAESGGFRILRMGGVLPAQAEEVPLADSHECFLILTPRSMSVRAETCGEP